MIWQLLMGFSYRKVYINTKGITEITETGTFQVHINHMGIERTKLLACKINLLDRYECGY